MSRAIVRSFVSFLVPVLLGSAVVVATAGSALAVTLTVNSLADTDDGHCDASPDCTLREAIIAANATVTKDTISFSVGSGTPSIAVTSALPALTKPVVISGNTGGATRIQLNGAGAGSGVDGLTISGGDSTISHLVISGFGGIGIFLTTAGGDRIQGCFIGTNAAGTAAQGNVRHGIQILQSNGNVVGGTGGATRNVISGNGLLGVIILSGNGNVIEGNRIGTDAAGAAAVPNAQDGIRMVGGLSNVIGGTNPGAGNLISGNTMHGINIVDIYSGTTTSGNLIQGNLIGTNAAGDAALGNGMDGVHFDTIPVHNTVGGTTPAARNVISGNGDDGVGLDLTTFNEYDTIAGNYIGTDVTGSFAIPNGGAGVHINAGRKNVVGGTALGAGNLISGNDGDGVLIESQVGYTDPARDNVIQGNLIGTNAAGTAALGNSIGIHVLDQPDNVIGGTTPGAGNVVSGNAIGIDISGSGTTVQGNRVGTDITGTAAVPNEADGIVVEYSDNAIGGTDPGSGNIIAFNGPSIVGGNGVLIKSASAVAVLGNSIFSNSILGIDLSDDGVTPNDAGDADSGDNELQNFPVVKSATSNGTTTHLIGKLSSTASTTFVVEFFSSASCDPSGNGEGGKFMGRITLSTGLAGTGNFDVVLNLPTKVGRKVTATATTPGNSTSEFSKCRGVLSGA